MSLPGRFLNIGSQRVFYHRAGRGRPLVLLHGFLLSHWSFRRIVPLLAADHEVIALDLPGFGESDRPPPDQYRYDETGFAETVIGALDELGLERASLLGHSLGGSVALAVAARRPERVDRLVLVSPMVYPFPIPPEGQALLLPYLGPVLFRTLYTRGVLRRYMVRSLYRDPALVTDDWVDYLWERVNRPGGLEAMHAAMRFCANPAAIPRLLRAVRAPSLVIWGEDDRLFPRASAARLTADLPGSELVLVPRCGHNPAEEKPDALVDAVRPFLAAGAESRRRPGLAAVPA
jgi:pimeloyl-ACP methyl ester carboxylesterase